MTTSFDRYMLTYRDDGSQDPELYRAWYAQEFGAYLANGRPDALGYKERYHNARLRRATGRTAAALRQEALRTQGERG